MADDYDYVQEDSQFYQLENDPSIKEEEGEFHFLGEEEEEEDEGSQIASSKETGEITDTTTEEEPSPRKPTFEKRDFDAKTLDKAAVFFGLIPPHVHVRELKAKIQERGLHATYIRWMGVRGYCIAYFSKTNGLTNESAANMLRGIRVGVHNKRLNVEPDRPRTDKEVLAKSRTRSYQIGTSEDDRIMTYRPANLKWEPRIFQADRRCRVFIGNVPHSCRAKELRAACEAKGLNPAEVDASKASLGFALIHFDREDGVNSNILRDKLDPLRIRDGSLLLTVQADIRSSRAEDRPPGAPKPGEEEKPPPSVEDEDGDEETPDMHRVWVGKVPYGVSLGEFKKEVEACDLKPDRYIWKTETGVVILLFKKESGVTMEELVRQLWGIRVGTKKRNLNVRPDGGDPDGIEEKISQEMRTPVVVGRGRNVFNFDDALEERMEHHQMNMRERKNYERKRNRDFFDRLDVSQQMAILEKQNEKEAEMTEKAEAEAMAKAEQELEAQFLETQKELEAEKVRAEIETRNLELQKQLAAVRTSLNVTSSITASELKEMNEEERRQYYNKELEALRMQKEQLTNHLLQRSTLIQNTPPVSFRVHPKIPSVRLPVAAPTLPIIPVPVAVPIPLPPNPLSLPVALPPSFQIPPPLSQYNAPAATGGTHSNSANLSYDDQLQALQSNHQYSLASDTVASGLPAESSIYGNSSQSSHDNTTRYDGSSQQQLFSSQSSGSSDLGRSRDNHAQNWSSDSGHWSSNPSNIDHHGQSTVTTSRNTEEAWETQQRHFSNEQQYQYLDQRQYSDSYAPDDWARRRKDYDSNYSDPYKDNHYNDIYKTEERPCKEEPQDYLDAHHSKHGDTSYNDWSIRPSQYSDVPRKSQETGYSRDSESVRVASSARTIKTEPPDFTDPGLSSSNNNNSSISGNTNNSYSCNASQRVKTNNEINNSIDNKLGKNNNSKNNSNNSKNNSNNRNNNSSSYRSNNRDNKNKSQNNNNSNNHSKNNNFNNNKNSCSNDNTYNKHITTSTTSNNHTNSNSNVSTSSNNNTSNTNVNKNTNINENSKTNNTNESPSSNSGKTSNVIIVTTVPATTNSTTTSTTTSTSTTAYRCVPPPMDYKPKQKKQKFNPHVPGRAGGRPKWRF